MNKLVVIAAVAAIACGCTTVNRNDGATDNLKPAIVKDVVHAKYSIDTNNKITATDKAYCLFGFITWGSTASHIADNAPGNSGVVGTAKNGAYANACDQAGCDELVAAHYKVTTDDYFVFAKAKAEVTGYPAKMTGIELIENKNPACGTIGGGNVDSSIGLKAILPLLGAFL